MQRLRRRRSTPGRARVSRRPVQLSTSGTARRWGGRCSGETARRILGSDARARTSREPRPQQLDPRAAVRAARPAPGSSSSAAGSGSCIAYHLTRSWGRHDVSGPGARAGSTNRHDLARRRPGRPGARRPRPHRVHAGSTRSCTSRCGRDRDRHRVSPAWARSGRPHPGADAGAARRGSRWRADAGIETRCWPRRRCRALWPAAAGGMWWGDAGTATARSTPAMPRSGARDRARARGATFVEGATVTGFGARRGRVIGVVTDAATVACDAVVLAAWPVVLGARAARRRLGSMYPAEHVWVMTKEAAGAESAAGDARPRRLSLRPAPTEAVTSSARFEPRGEAARPGAIDNGGLRWSSAPTGSTSRRCSRDAAGRLPGAGSNARVHAATCAPRRASRPTPTSASASPRGAQPFVAAGFNSQGIIYSPGAGKALAEWIVEGAPTFDSSEVDVRALASWANDRWLHETHAGNARAPLRDALAEPSGPTAARHPALPLARPPRGGGAVFGELAQLGAPDWFVPGGPRSRSRGTTSGDRTGSRTPPRSTAPPGRPVASSTCRRTPSSGARTRTPSGAAAPVHERRGRRRRRLVYTLFCNAAAGSRRTGRSRAWTTDRFLVVTPSPTSTAPRDWLRRRLPGGDAVADVTSAYAVLHLAGPKSRALLSKLTDADLSDEASRSSAPEGSRSRGAQAWALRVSYTGELGWELYVPTEFARRPVRRDRRGRGEAGPAACGLPRVRRAAPGAGLPLVGPRHGNARRSLRGGTGLRGRPARAISSGTTRWRRRSPSRANARSFP